MFPEQYNRSFFNAQHGSWDRDEKIGYRVMQGTVDSMTGNTTSYSIFAQGWLQGVHTTNASVWGAPSWLPLPSLPLLHPSSVITCQNGP